MFKKYRKFFLLSEYLIDSSIIISCFIFLFRQSILANLSNGLALLIIIILLISYKLSSQRYKVYSFRRFKKILLQEYYILKNILLFFTIFLSIALIVLNIHNLGFENIFLKSIYYFFSLAFYFSLKNLLMQVFLYYIRYKGLNNRKVIVVGNGEEFIAWLNKMDEKNSWGYKFAGYLSGHSHYMQIAKNKTFNFLGHYDYLFEIFDKDKSIDEILLILPNNDSAIYAEMIKEAKKRKINVVLYNALIEEPVSIESLVNANSKINQVMKFLFDKIASLILLVVFSPIMVCIAIMIKLTSKGSIFFVQERVGINGKIFNFYKFRTMIQDADKQKQKLIKANEMDGPVFKMSNDPRITKIGRFLRKTSLDELPQLLNVIKGDMSLVGPRPPLPIEVASYNNWHWKRLFVKPGITCYWQTEGRNNVVSFEQWVEMDIKYIKDDRFITYLKILFKTIPAVLSCRGAK